MGIIGNPPSGLDLWRHPLPTPLNHSRPHSKGWWGLPWYWALGTHLEGDQESHQLQTEHHPATQQPPRLPQQMWDGDHNH